MLREMAKSVYICIQHFRIIHSGSLCMCPHKSGKGNETHRHAHVVRTSYSAHITPSMEFGQKWICRRCAQMRCQCVSSFFRSASEATHRKTISFRWMRNPKANNHTLTLTLAHMVKQVSQQANELSEHRLLCVPLTEHITFYVQPYSYRFAFPTSTTANNNNDMAFSTFEHEFNVPSCVAIHPLLCVHACTRRTRHEAK